MLGREKSGVLFGLLAFKMLLNGAILGAVVYGQHHSGRAVVLGMR